MASHKERNHAMSIEQHRQLAEIANAAAALRPTFITRLPTELLHLIALELAYQEEWATLGALRGSCTIIYDAATPAFWHDYTIASHENARLRQDQLLRLSKHRDSLTRHIRYLDIDLSEWEDEEPDNVSARMPGLIFALLTAPSVGALRHLTTLCLTAGDCRDRIIYIPREVSDAFCNLKNLKRLILDPCWFEDDELCLLEALPSLVQLTLECYERCSSILDTRGGTPASPAARLSKLALLNVDAGSTTSELVELCINTIRQLEIEGIALPNTSGIGFRAQDVMSYEIYRGMRDKLETLGANQTIHLPLQHITISSMKVFEPATDVPEEENQVLDAKGQVVDGVPAPPKYTLGLLLELLTEHAPNFKHLKLKDYGSIASFPPGNVLSLWPTAYGITELELVASSKDPRRSLLGKDTLPCLRAFLSRLPSLTQLHLEGFLESHSPTSLAVASMVTCSMNCPGFLAFTFMIQEEFPLIENVVWRWRGENWKDKALVCRKAEKVGEMFEREVWGEYTSL